MNFILFKGPRRSGKMGAARAYAFGLSANCGRVCLIDASEGKLSSYHHVTPYKPVEEDDPGTLVDSWESVRYLPYTIVVWDGVCTLPRSLGKPQMILNCRTPYSENP